VSDCEGRTRALHATCLSELLLDVPQAWNERAMLGWRGARGWEWLSRREVSRRVLRVARWLRSLGIRHGHRVGILGHNSGQWCIADFAILHIGAVTVPAYFTDPAEAVRYVFEDAGCSILLVEPGEQQAKLDGFRVPVFPLYGDADITLDAMSRDTAFDVLCDLPAVGKGDLATLIYTSGTTGKPKGVMLTHGNLLADVAAGLGGVPVFDSDTFLSFLPVSHAFERTVGHFLPIACGARIAYVEDITTLMRDIPEVRPTVMISVPRLYEKIYAGVQEKLSHAASIQRSLFAGAQALGMRRFELRRQGSDLRGTEALAYRVLDALVHGPLRKKMGGRLRVFISGGAALHPDIVQFLLAAGLPVCPGYGLSEASPVLTVNPERYIKPETVGPALPGVELRLAEDGELLARGQMVMQGYWNRPQESAEAVTADGWLHTGDIASMDKDGYVRIVDRKKELIALSNGEKVSPSMVEKCLAMDHAIPQAMVIGEQRPYLTVLVAADEKELGGPWQKEHGSFLPSDWRNSQAVHDWLMARMRLACRELPNFMQIRDFIFVDEEWSQASGMLTPTLKFKRHLILARYQAEIDAMYRNIGSTRQDTVAGKVKGA
jgi:long-chain acyl-CoA synthetase